MKDDELYNDLESWERDYELIEKEDWKKLLECRTEDLKTNPFEYYTVQRYLEALNYNKKFNNTIEFVKQMQKDHNEDVENYKHEILDALFGLGLNENDFEWKEKPEVYHLDEILERKMVEFISQKRYGLSINKIYEKLVVSDFYLRFGFLEFESFISRSKKFELRKFRNKERVRIIK